MSLSFANRLLNNHYPILNKFISIFGCLNINTLLWGQIDSRIAINVTADTIEPDFVASDRSRNGLLYKFFGILYPVKNTTEQLRSDITPQLQKMLDPSELLGDATKSDAEDLANDLVKIYVRENPGVFYIADIKAAQNGSTQPAIDQLGRYKLKLK